MQERINQFFRLRPGEAGLVFVLGGLLLGNSAALGVANVVAVSGFLSQVSAYNILIVWAIDMALLILATGLQSLIIDRFDRIALVKWITFIFAVVYVILRLLFALGVPSWLNYTFLYILSDQQWLFFPILFWILAGDVFDVAQGKRLFPLIAAFGFIGHTLGLALSAAAPKLLGSLGVSTVELLTINVLIYLLSYVLAFVGLRGVQIRETTQKSETMRETLVEGWEFIKEVPAFRYMTFAMLAIGLVLTILQYHFLVDVDLAFTSPDAFQAFYGYYNLAVTVLAVLFQTFVTSRVIEKITLKNTFLVLPVVMFAGSAWMLLLPGIVSSAGGRGISRLAFDTIDQSARKAFQALVPEERRGRVSIFIESYLPALGTIIGCGVTGLIIFIGLKLGRDDFFLAYLVVAVLASAFVIWAVMRMRTVYDKSLLNWRLKRRQRRASVLDKLDF